MDADNLRTIRPINKASIHKICSGQVIFDLATAVKELVENSLDAGASSVEIKLKDYGAESFEVADNGCGISPENYQAITLKYHTSKIKDFADLQFLSSFGFRGEALSSLCALGDLNVVTRTISESVATHLIFDHSGRIVEQKAEARPVGTTVTVSRLFSSLPVRYKEFSKNIRREYSRLLSVLQAYALMIKGVRLVCTHVTGKNRTVILKTQGTNSIKDNIISVFGTKTANCLESVDLHVGMECQIEGFISKPGSGSGRAAGDRQFFYINNRPVDLPKVAKMLNELYRSFNSQQYPMAVLNFILPTTAYDVNVTPDKRKVFLHTESELLVAMKDSLEGIYAPDKYSYTLHKVENVSLDQKGIELPEFETQKCSLSEEGEATENLCDDADIAELSRPSHSLLTDGNGGQASVKQDLSDAFIKCADSSLCSNGSLLISGGPINALKDTVKHVNPIDGFGKGHLSTAQDKDAQRTLLGYVMRNKRELEGPLTEEPILKKWIIAGPGLSETKKILSGCSVSSGMKRQEDVMSCANIDKKFTRLGNIEDTDGFDCDEEVDARIRSDENIQKSGEKSQLCNIQDVQFAKSTRSSSISSLSPTDAQQTVPNITVSTSAGARSNEMESSVLWTIDFAIDRLRSRFEKHLRNYGDLTHRGKPRCRTSFFAASMEADGMVKEGTEKEEALAAATMELERAFNKEDFKRMKVVGQFNLGFILAKLNNDLFIIDQHASDEKYNFERLSKTTVLNRQPLLKPLPLELSAVEEVIVTTHLDAFRRNGFDFVEKEGPPGQRLCLTAIPFSKNVSFGVADVQEMAAMLAEEPTYSKPSSVQSSLAFNCDKSHVVQLSCSGHSIRPSRVKAMLASRACRSSIMIGDALSKKEMEKVVWHLAELGSPWNCPHGRPTMRHLIDLGSLKRS